MYHRLLLSSPFDAIADFARRSTGGGGGRSRRDDSRDRDLRSDVCFEQNEHRCWVSWKFHFFDNVKYWTQNPGMRCLSPTTWLDLSSGRGAARSTRSGRSGTWERNMIWGSKETFLCRSGATINIMESGQKRRERSPEPGPLVRWELSLWTMCNESLTQRTFLGSGKNHRDNRQYWGGELRNQIETISCAWYHDRWLLLSLLSTWQWTWEEQGWVHIIVIETVLKKQSSPMIMRIY